MIAVEVVVIFLLIVLNGFLAMSELAIVSARRSRLQMLAEGGNLRARTALELSARQGRFLSAVQIGITLCGVFAGTFSGATIAERFSEWLETFGLSNELSETIAFAVVVIAVTYLSLILGELVPKQIALRNAERIALLVARPMFYLLKATSPIAFLLDASSWLVLTLLGQRREEESRVTDEEIKALLAEAESTGEVKPVETTMIASVLRLGERPVRAIMTPRHQVDWIDLDAPAAEISDDLRRTQHARLVAAHGSIDEAVGTISIKAALDMLLDGKPLDAKQLVNRVPMIHDRFDALEVIDLLKEAGTSMALVVDEHGSFEGIVTRADILSSIGGEFHDAGTAPSGAVRRFDGSWLLDGSMPVDEMASLTGIELSSDRRYHTVAGFLLDRLKKLPLPGEAVDVMDWRFEILDMDGRRIDKVLAEKRSAPAQDIAGAAHEE